MMIIITTTTTTTTVIIRSAQVISIARYLTSIYSRIFHASQKASCSSLRVQSGLEKGQPIGCVYFHGVTWRYIGPGTALYAYFTCLWTQILRNAGTKDVPAHTWWVTGRALDGARGWHRLKEAVSLIKLADIRVNPTTPCFALPREWHKHIHFVIIFASDWPPSVQWCICVIWGRVLNTVVTTVVTLNYITDFIHPKLEWVPLKRAGFYAVNGW